MWKETVAALFDVLYYMTSKRAAGDPRLRPLGHRNGLYVAYLPQNKAFTTNISTNLLVSHTTVKCLTPFAHLFQVTIKSRYCSYVCRIFSFLSLPLQLLLPPTDFNRSSCWKL
jgi:hypothetical protein